EYWRGDASLTHISPNGKADLDPAPESRIYLFVGTQHADARMLPEPGDAAIDGTERAHPPNTIDYRPLLRAALVNLDRWVSEGVEPPPSKHPRLDNGTAVSRSDLLAGLGAIPGLSRPDPERLWVLREMDMGPEADKGIPRLPVHEGRAYPAFVSAVDSAGNEVAGVRLPDVAVPVATYLGWNPRHPGSGAPEQIIPMQGSSLPFAATRAATRAARERTNDPRPALEERYVNREDYAKRAQAEARRLVAGGYLLEEDVGTVVANCAAHYDMAVEETA
ncbi:MAG: alpha/beta hydrolase domain-containing protein, partial [Chloroflexi bacterium]|nr:alpha/beta hydrolase domain-containing protein [Chloroflexota bacterium]